MLLAAGQVGGVVGAALVPRLVRRWGSARALLAVKVGTAPIALLVPLAAAGPRLALFVIGSLGLVAGVMAGNVIVRGFHPALLPGRADRPRDDRDATGELRLDPRSVPCSAVCWPRPSGSGRRSRCCSPASSRPPPCSPPRRCAACAICPQPRTGRPTVVVRWQDRRTCPTPIASSRGWTPSSARPPSPSAGRSASSPAPARARRGPSRTASPTPCRPAPCRRTSCLPSPSPPARPVSCADGCARSGRAGCRRARSTPLRCASCSTSRRASSAAACRNSSTTRSGWSATPPRGCGCASTAPNCATSPPRSTGPRPPS